VIPECQLSNSSQPIDTKHRLFPRDHFFFLLSAVLLNYYC
jgi:hypothetical protein